MDLNFYKSKAPWAKIIRDSKLLGEDSNGVDLLFSSIVELDMDDDEIKLRA